jgi:hypothetical protein
MQKMTPMERRRRDVATRHEPADRIGAEIA